MCRSSIPANARDFADASIVAVAVATVAAAPVLAFCYPVISTITLQTSRQQLAAETAHDQLVHDFYLIVVNDVFDGCTAVVLQL